jgi:CRISPR-associated endonuclease/helicase Cas3
MGYTHDLGKGTLYFQKYLDDMIQKGKSDVDVELKSHGLLSALYTYLQLRDYNKKLALMAYVIVKKHHGNLGNISIEFKSNSVYIGNQKKILRKQIEALDKEELNRILSSLSLKIIDAELLDILDEIRDEADEYEDKLSDNQDFEDYVLFKFLFSVLILADKEDAIFHDQQNIEYDLPYDIVDKYKKIKFKNNSSNLGDIRNRIYDEVNESVKKANNRIMSITVPTGTGKTLTAMAAALSLNKKVREEMKIIYCLPFTSIIDQNYNEYSTMIEKVMGKEKVTNDRLLKHHHLTDLSYINEEKNFKSNESRFLIENWNSQIVVTTFMQFFETVFSNRNDILIKYNSLSNSIVLLDEVQTVPYKYWLIINKLFKFMTERLNMYFIFITATQPLIFGKDEIEPLIKNEDEYFKAFRRTKLHINHQKLKFSDFLLEVQQMIFDNNSKNILIILNTVKAAQETYDHISNLKLKNTNIHFLSTGIIPKERWKRINKIKKGKRRKIVVSTQLIEAGVDIDMDIVVRDMATLDSINQSAGRCNRESRGEYLGDVYLYHITNESGREYCRFIYDSFLIEVTNKVLQDKNLVFEQDYLNLNRDYFNNVYGGMSRDESRKLMNMISTLRFEDIENNFELIENQNKVSVFIESDKAAMNTWRKYISILEEPNLIKRRERFDAIKKNFYDNVINVFKDKVRENEVKGIAYVGYNAMSSSYNTNTGYILEEGDKIF